MKPTVRALLTAAALVFPAPAVLAQADDVRYLDKSSMLAQSLATSLPRHGLAADDLSALTLGEAARLKALFDQSAGDSTRDLAARQILAKAAARL